MAYTKEERQEYNRLYKLRKPDLIREKTRRNNLKKMTEFRQYLADHKSKPCMDCGVQYPYYVMHFDHVRGEKKFGIASGSAYWSKPGKPTLDAEIAKCDVVCSNCHAERTFGLRMGKNPMDTSAISGMLASQMQPAMKRASGTMPPQGPEETGEPMGGTADSESSPMEVLTSSPEFAQAVASIVMSILGGGSEGAAPAAGGGGMPA